MGREGDFGAYPFSMSESNANIVIGYLMPPRQAKCPGEAVYSIILGGSKMESRV